MADELPGLDAFGEALVAAVGAARRGDGGEARRRAAGRTGGSRGRRCRRPALDRFGTALVARTRGLDRRRGRARRFGVALGIVLPIAATSGAATAVVLREAVIRPPDPAHVPDEQTPLAGTAVVSTVRAKDPGHALPWTVRVARSKTGFTCTTVGQVRDGVFGLTGLDGVFRRLPGRALGRLRPRRDADGCRVAAADRVQDVRTIVYGAAGEGLRTRDAEDRARRAAADGRPGRDVRRRRARLPRGQRGGRDAALRGRAQRAPQLRRLAGHAARPRRRPGVDDRALHVRQALALRERAHRAARLRTGLDRPHRLPGAAHVGPRLGRRRPPLPARRSRRLLASTAGPGAGIRAHGRLGRRPRQQDAARGHAARRRRSTPADADARGRASRPCCRRP